MIIAPEHLEKLKEISGPNGWIDDEDSMESFLIEPRDKFKGKTPLILLPDSPNKVSKIVTYCAQYKIPIVPQGGNSGLVGGSMPSMQGDEILLSTKRLNKIYETDTHNQTMTVGAGCILSHIHDQAQAMDCIFPLHLASEGSCMIGGNLSTNAGGVNVLHYGNMRNLVLGLEVVLANGKIWNGLSGLRKDNTGYDLKHLFIGAEGTLGIITAATLKLFPNPHEKQTAFVAVKDPKAAVDFLTLTRKISGDCMTAFELVPRLGLDMVIRNMPHNRDPLPVSYDWYILLECTSSLSRDLLDLQQVMEHILETALNAGIIRDGVIAKNQTESADLWRLRENISEAQKYEGGSIKHDISVPISAIPEFMAKAKTLIQIIIPEARPVPFGHLGDGNIHYNVSQPPDMNKHEFLDRGPELNQHIHDLVKKFKGSFSAEHGIGHLKVEELYHYKTGTEIEMMCKIKHVLDPDNIMNPNVIIKQ